MPGARSLPAGHTTVNASTIEQSRTEALPFVRSVSAALEHTAEALHGMSEQVASLSPEVASVYAEAANSDDVEARFSDMVSLSSLTNDDAGLLREDVYNDMIVKGAWANNIAKRVKSSPEMRATKLQLLQAQVLRAQQVATAKSQEAAAASAAATAAADKLEDLEQQLERERLAQEQRLAQERLAQAHLAQEETAREQAAREQAAHAAQSQTSLRKDVHPHNLIQQPSSKPKLVVVELEGGWCHLIRLSSLKPLWFKTKD